MSLLDADDLLGDESPEISWDHIPWDEVEASCDNAIASREPFTFHDERDRAMIASFYGDHQDAAYYARCEDHRQKADEAVWAEGVTKRLGRADLAALAWLDSLSDCREDEYDEEAGGERQYGSWQCQRLEAIGRRLHKADHTFWARLRKFGPSQSLVAQANASLFPRRASGRGITANRRRARARGRRVVRRVRSASRGSPGDDSGPSEPPGDWAGRRTRSSGRSR
jgi:hypothetical protein